MNVWIGLFALAVIMLVITLVRFSRLIEERNDLLGRITAARRNLFPLLDDTLYRSLKVWRKEYPKKKVLVLGHGAAVDADRFVRALFDLNLTPYQERNLAALIGKLGAKFEVYIGVDFTR